jgi:5'-nucleotidase
MPKVTGGFIMLNRRNFIRTAALAGTALYAMPAFSYNGYNKITILHTNDLHCHFEPFPENDAKYPGRGGMNRIAAYVRKLRQTEPELLLLDSGDFSQGTPYYNFFQAEVVLKLMSEMGYAASTIGNHEFDSGLESLRDSMNHARFPLISSNYDFTNTPVQGLIKKNLVLEVKGIRIGIYAIGIELLGLVGKSLCGNTQYLEPLAVAREQEEYLRKEEQCDFVICLSHLGYQYDTPQTSDVVLAKNTRYTDLILGGHTHTFLEAPVEIKNLEKQPVVINQVGWAALMLGQLDFYFEKNKKAIFDLSKNKQVG